MNFGICRITELLGHKIIGMFGKNFFGLLDSALHELQSVREDDSRAVGSQERHSFYAYVIRHGENDLIALRRAYHR